MYVKFEKNNMTKKFYQNVKYGYQKSQIILISIHGHGFNKFSYKKLVADLCSDFRFSVFTQPFERVGPSPTAVGSAARLRIRRRHGCRRHRFE
jgi:hypothetical protein